MTRDQRIKELIEDYKKRKHIYDEKVELEEHCTNLINEYLDKYLIMCKDCALKYSKDMNYYCPHVVGPVCINGYCDHGRKSVKDIANKA